jgi:hypothetical protein
MANAMVPVVQDWGDEPLLPVVPNEDDNVSAATINEDIL